MKNSASVKRVFDELLKNISTVFKLSCVVHELSPYTSNFKLKTFFLTKF